MSRRPATKNSRILHAAVAPVRDRRGMTGRSRALLWCLPLALHCGEALAWGLYTHFYFAQLLLWVTPLADPRFRRALSRFPELLFAGCCLPDVSLFSGQAGARELRVTHQWSAAHRLLREAATDEERALAVGYASHLLTDIIAHNYFVPAHETLWLDTPMMTHAAAEWAMDAHVAHSLFMRPAQVMDAQLERMADYASYSFECPRSAARRAILYLLRGERLLRTLRLGGGIYRAARAADRSLVRRFDYYAQETTSRLAQVNRVIAGDAPAWGAEVACPRTARDELAAHGPRALAWRLPLPRDLFAAVRVRLARKG